MYGLRTIQEAQGRIEALEQGHDQRITTLEGAYERIEELERQLERMN